MRGAHVIFDLAEMIVEERDDVGPLEQKPPSST